MKAVMLHGSLMLPTMQLLRLFIPVTVLAVPVGAFSAGVQLLMTGG